MNHNSSSERSIISKCVFLNPQGMKASLLILKESCELVCASFLIAMPFKELKKMFYSH